MSPIRRLRFRHLRPAILSLLALFVAAPSWGSLPLGQSLRPEPIAPAEDVTVHESGLRFAWRPAFSTARHTLLVSRAPFETRGWTKLPADPAIEIHALERPVASLADLGMTLEGDARLYWAAASEDPGTGKVTFSEVRTLLALRKFTNQVEQSPYLRTLPISRMTPEASGEPHRIRLAAGYTIDPRLGEPVLPEQLRGADLDANATRSYIVYYGDADPEEARRRILASGGSVVSYVPDHAFLVRLAPSSSLSLDQEAWVGAYQPAYKLSNRLDPQAAEQTVTVMVFPDGSVDAVSAMVQMSGGRVLIRSENGINRVLRVAGSGSVIEALARQADVMWIEPYVRPVLDNANAQWVVQTNANGNRRIWDLGIRGEGQVLTTSDSGIDMTHNQFRDPALGVAAFGDYPTHRKVIGYKMGSTNPDVVFGDHAGAGNHGSHTGGTVAGSDDPLAGSTNDGVAKAAKLYFMDISGPVLANSVDPFADLNDLFQPAYDGNAGGAARISSNSWGAPVEGAYDLNSLNVDQFMWNHPDFLICFSNGNNGPTSGTTGSPATAKSSIGVGGTGNSTSSASLYTSTSRGPTDDGRRKPTVCSPAINLTSAGPGPASYQILTGTSMASPNTAGAAALMRQYLTEGWYPTGAAVPANGFSPSAALLKAMVVNSGSNNGVTGQTAPNNAIGWGRVNSDSVLFFAGDVRRVLLVDQTEGLAHQQTIEFQINVTDNTIPLEIALCWTDYPGNPAVVPQLVNDLDLLVTNGTTTGEPGDVTYRGNQFTTGVSNVTATQDHVNVEECVRAAANATQQPTGLWTVRISGFSIPAGPQPFGLCITGGIGTTAGTLALDRAAYGSASTVEVRVTDTNAGASVTVNLASPTEPGGETLVIPGSNGIYQGSLLLTPFISSGGDGKLRVSNGDLITATYSDASPVATLTARAVVSFNPPIITNVSSLNQGNGTVLVTWTTDENASSQVYYGTTPALGSSTTFDPLAALSHQVTITGLTVGETYYFDVESQDLDGNVTRDDNGGTHYKLTVSPSGDILLVYGAAFERPARYNNALNANGWTFDTWQGVLSESPNLGDLASGMRSYKAVWWQIGLEYYPPFTDTARDVVTQYLDGGGRLAVVGHDIAWAFSDPASDFYTVDRDTWVQSTLHADYVLDPPTWTSVSGVAADPISGAYIGGLSYAEHRAGASGDELNLLAAGGTISASWMSGDGSPDECGLRWESAGPLGTPGSGFWADEPSRLAGMFFEWSNINTFTESDATRHDILNKTLIWLMGRERPTVAVTSPNGGEVLTGASHSITWTEGASGASIASRTVQYSVDSGQSWVTLATGAGPSPYNWDLTTVPNSPTALVRVLVEDDGSPAFSNRDQSNAIFTINRAGGDLVGPSVVAGSIRANPNPIDAGSPSTVTATVTDFRSGGSNVAAAEWSYGDSPAAAGSGTAMTGTFTSHTVNVSAVMNTTGFQAGIHQLFVRGQDAAGNWGNATSVPVHVNDPAFLGIGDVPKKFELRQNAPNPIAGHTVITFALPVETPVALEVFDVTGRQVRQLIRETVGPGVHNVRWDRNDDSGRRVEPGLYYYRLVAGGKSFERRMVTLN